jgi:DNA-binding transcriptional MerR regulator
MRIGELARKVGMSAETIRFYERENLLFLKPVREKNGYRSYTDVHYKVLHFIKKTKELGFSLKEIQEFLNLYSQREVLCEDLEEKLNEKRREINKKIANLEGIRSSLDSLQDRCTRECSSETRCNIMECL